MSQLDDQNSANDLQQGASESSNIAKKGYDTGKNIANDAQKVGQKGVDAAKGVHNYNQGYRNAKKADPSLNFGKYTGNKAKDAALDKVNNVKDGLHNTAEAIKSTPENIKNGAIDAANAVKNAPRNIANGAKNAANNTINAARNAPGAIKNGAKNAANSIKAAPGKVENAAKTAAKETVNSIKNAPGAIKKGVKNAPGAIKKGAKNAAKAAGRSIKNLGIKLALTGAGISLLLIPAIMIVIIFPTSNNIQQTSNVKLSSGLSPNVQTAADFMKNEMGFTDIQTAAVIGCWMSESGEDLDYSAINKFNPNLGASDGGKGVAQWTNNLVKDSSGRLKVSSTGRETNLRQFCYDLDVQNGKTGSMSQTTSGSWNNLDYQLQFFKHEYDNNIACIQGYESNFEAAQTIDDATYWFFVGYEAGGGIKAAIDRGNQYWVDQLETRRNNAKSITNSMTTSSSVELLPYPENTYIPGDTDENDQFWSQIWTDIAQNGLTFAAGDPKTCTNFAHWRFWKQYGYDCCSNGNGSQLAKNTVNTYPDKFELHYGEAKEGAIFSASAINHTGFIVKVDGDYIWMDDGNVGSKPGGIRINNKWSKKEFYDHFGANSSFAWPKESSSS